MSGRALGNVGTKLAEVVSLPPPRGMREQWGIAQQRFEAGDLEGALRIWESIASEGYIEAYVEVGNIYEIGKGGVSQDLKKAEYWYRRAIDGMDDPYAHAALGRMYFNGIGMPRDHAKAFLHLSKAESLGRPATLLMLGLLYQYGSGTFADLTKARSLFEAAAAKDYVRPMLQLASIEFRCGNFVSSLKWRLRGIRTVLKIGPKNRDDPRFAGMPGTQ